MNSRLDVFIKRIKVISAGGAARMLMTLNGVILSFVVVRTQSPALWGQLVYYFLILDFGFSIVSWGATHYLLREFSLNPKRMKLDLGQSISSRSLLLALLLLAISFLPTTVTLKIVLIVWASSRFVHQGFEPLAQVERHFYFTLFIELIALVIVLVPLLLNTVDIEGLVILFTLSMLVRAVAFAFFYRRQISFQRPSLQYFKDAFPFLLLTFSAIVQQRMDLYCVAYYLNEPDTAAYQIFINFLIFCQYASSLLLMPYAKNIFRLSPSSLLKLEHQFMLAGIFLSAIAIGLVFILTRVLYHFYFPWPLYLTGYFYVLMIYLYLLRNYEMRKASRIMHVAAYSFLSGLVNLLFSILLIPELGLGGALLSGLIAQVFIVILYHGAKVPVLGRRLRSFIKP